MEGNFLTPAPVGAYIPSTRRFSEKAQSFRVIAVPVFVVKASFVNGTIGNAHDGET
jgi:hypothetical protein